VNRAHRIAEMADLTPLQIARESGCTPSPRFVERQLALALKSNAKAQVYPQLVCIMILYIYLLWVCRE
jgi:hypothetical protein